MNATLRCFGLVVLGLACVYAAPVSAQPYPTRSVQIVVPFPTGGATDVTSRVLAQGLTDHMGQSVVVINRPGGSATIGMNSVAKSKPDGYTLGVASLSFVANPPFMVGKMPFDTEKDLVPVSLIATVPLVMVIYPGVPAKTVKEFVALAKAKPGTLNYSSVGVASSGHLAMELFESLTGTKLTHVAYNTSPTPPVVAGEAQALISPVTANQAFIKSGRLVALGVTTAKRVPTLPDVPTIAEAGVPGFEMFEWVGLVTPTGTPNAVIDQLHQAIVKTVAEPEVKKGIENDGGLVWGSTPAELAAHIKKELATWNKIGAEIQARDAAANK